MAFIYTQTDTSTTFDVGCSGRSAGATTAGHLIASGSTAGATEFDVDPGNNATNVAVLSMNTTGGVGQSTWEAGDYVVRLNVTTARGTNTWTETYICERTGVGGFNSVASLTGQSIDLSTTGVKTMTVNRSTDFSAAGTDSDLFIVVVISNSDQHGNSALSTTPDQDIDTPIQVDAIPQDLPTGTAFASSSLPFPNNNVTGWVGVIDTSQLPPSWWSFVDSNDGATGRISKDDGVEDQATELASDWVNFDTGSQSGLVWYYWTGDKESAVSESVRIYPPTASRAAYDVTGSFGRNSVWKDYLAVLPLYEDPTGTAPQFTDHTGNGYDGTSFGSQTSTDVINGVLDKAIHFDGNDDLVELANTASISDDFTIEAIMNPADNGGSNASLAGESGTVTAPKIEEFDNTNNLGWSIDGTVNYDSGYATPYGTDSVLMFRQDSSVPEINFVHNGTEVGTPYTGASLPITVNLSYAIAQNPTTSANASGSYQYFRIRNSLKSNDLAAYEWDNIGSISNFYNWSWQGPTTGTTVEASFSIAQSNSITDSGGAIAEGGLSIGQNAGISDGAGAIGEGSLSIDQINNMNFNADAIGEAALNLTQQTSNLITSGVNIEVALNLATQISILTSANASTEASILLGLVNSIINSGDATAEGEIVQTLLNTISNTGTATIDASVAQNIINSITATSLTSVEGQITLALLNSISPTEDSVFNASIVQNLVNSLSSDSSATIQASATLGLISNLTVAANATSEAQVSLAISNLFSIVSETGIDAQLALSLTNSISTGAVATAEASLVQNLVNQVITEEDSIVDASVALNLVTNLVIANNATSNAQISVATTNLIDLVAEISTAGDIDVSISLAQSTSIRTGADAIAEATIAIALRNIISTLADAAAEGNLSLSTVNDIVINGGSAVDASFSIALSNAISTSADKTIEVGYTLDSSTGISTSQDSDIQAAIQLSTQSSLSLLASAIAEAGLSVGSITDIQIAEGVLSATIEIDEDKTITIKFENQTLKTEGTDNTIDTEKEDQIKNTNKTQSRNIFIDSKNNTSSAE